MSRPVKKADFFWPLAVLAVFTVGLLAVAGAALVGEIDHAATLREQSVVENGLMGRMREVSERAATEVVWDEAVAHLDNHFDPEWARQNVGVMFAKALGSQNTFVLSANDLPLFAAERGRPVSLESYTRYAQAAAPLIVQVRQAEAARGALPAPRPDGTLLAEPIQSSSICNVGGQLYVLSATLVQPDFGKVLPRGPRSALVVNVLPMDGAFLDELGDRFLLKHLHIEIGALPRQPDEAEVVLHDAAGALVGALVWPNRGPGTVILGKLGWPVVSILILLAAGVLFLYWRGRRMAAGLISSEARAAHLAYHDALTGLPNRVLFFDRLAHALNQLGRSGEILAVHCIDLDRLKGVNDTFGHHVGDELIQEAAKRMARLCRSSDTFARLSGDEFAVVQTRASVNAAAALASRLTEAMSQPFDLGPGRVFIGCSIGIALISEKDLPPPEALRQADLALYRTKQTAKGQFCFFEHEMDAAIKTRRGLESDLREALDQNGLHLVYQPQFNDRDGMTGVEALARWRHPVRGNISPAFFVPIAEECGLIMDLGMFILRRAFEDSKRWTHLKVAINVSAKQLRMKDFVTRVIELTTEIGVSPSQFELEITEGILLGDDPETHDMLEQLRRLGFSLALDDFGTGYSSLSYLQRYPIDKIKIDRSFIANLGVEAESEAVIGAIVKLAQALNLSVIAEGVETDDQHQRLSAAGCADMQGYLFGRPVDAHEIDALWNRAPELSSEG